MERKFGVVKEVYIPNDNVDVMLSNRIGFKVYVNNEIITIEEEQNEINANIYKDDKVIVTKQIISGKEFMDIELCGDDYE